LFLPNLKKDFNFNESIKACKRIGVKGVQLWNVSGIFDPKNLTIDKKSNYWEK